MLATLDTCMRGEKGSDVTFFEEELVVETKKEKKTLLVKMQGSVAIKNLLNNVESAKFWCNNLQVRATWSPSLCP